MGHFKRSSVVLGFLGVIVLLLTRSEGRLFKVLNKDNTVCGMMDVNFTVTFTALQGSKKLKTVTYNQDFYRNYITGDCNRNMAVHFDNTGSWNLHVHFKVVPDPKYMLTRSVSFVPGLVFGKLAPSNKTENFVNADDAKIGPVDCSYKCTVDDKSYYKRENSTDSNNGKSQTTGIIYTVFLDVQYIQVQVSHVHRERFGPTVACSSALHYYP
ncbi:hypothetical protein ElyMa_002653900 [Elysia marginata]|uniref:Uncharacterized protein n=1 Tax=Elysia marginata TaxID=1093978 RepID=A0AAV4H6W1_9GAST|nr:hypothetical protein ElyMa_002653900 [Elysia marginata]